MPSVEARLARNEVMFRAINERIRELAARFEPWPRRSRFICECADETCVERVSLDDLQYDDVRAIPARFVVAPGMKQPRSSSRCSSAPARSRSCGRSASPQTSPRELRRTPAWESVLARGRPAVPRASPRHEGTVDVAVIGAGVTGCAAALRLAEAGLRVRVHDAARGRRGRERPQRRLRAARRRDALRRRPRDLRCRTRSRPLELDGARARPHRGARRRRATPRGSFRLAADEEEREQIRAEYEAMREDGIDAEWFDDLPGAARRRASTAGSCMRATARCSRRAWCGGSPRSPLRRARRSASTTASTTSTRSTPSRWSSRRTATATASCRSSPTRSGRRAGQVIVSEPIDRVLYDQPHYARQGFDYWQQLPDGRVAARRLSRRLDHRRAHRRRGDDAE